MRNYFALIFCACVATHATASAADAQIVTITSANYVAGPPPKADPQGTWSIPATTNAWRVKFEYGTITGGTFTLDDSIGVGGIKILAVPRTGGNGTWGPLGQETLKNPLPANTNVRARLQKQDPMTLAWSDQGSPAYMPCP
jgi:hypothetical protein